MISAPNKSGATDEFLASQTVFVLPTRANFQNENKHLATELGPWDRDIQTILIDLVSPYRIILSNPHANGVMAGERD